MSPPFVFRELEHVLIPEFGDLILEIERWRSSRKRQEQIPRGMTTEERKILKNTRPLQRAQSMGKVKTESLASKVSYIKSTTKAFHSA